MDIDVSPVAQIIGFFYSETYGEFIACGIHGQEGTSDRHCAKLIFFVEVVGVGVGKDCILSSGLEAAGSRRGYEVRVHIFIAVDTEPQGVGAADGIARPVGAKKGGGGKKGSNVEYRINDCPALLTRPSWDHATQTAH